MDEQPQKLEAKQRWFRFRLSTVLILTAIVAWGMAIGFYRNEAPERLLQARGTPPPSDVKIVAKQSDGQSDIYLVEQKILNFAIAWPAIALVAFFAWKVAWAVVERRRRGFARATLLERSLH